MCSNMIRNRQFVSTAPHNLQTSYQTALNDYIILYFNVVNHKGTGTKLYISL